MFQCLKNKKLNRIILFLFYLISSICKSTAQDFERTYTMTCQYELEYQPDSTVSIKKKAIMGLLLNQNNSLFGDWKNLLVDTVMSNFYKLNPKTEHPPKGVFKGSNNEITYRIYKDSQNKIWTIDKVKLITSPTYEYEDPKSIFSWKILSDTATISGYNCQKAECDFGNRHWTAWFTLQIPISDGPYKFCGLPGLIIQVSDTKDSWKFTLSAIERKEFIYNFYNRSSTEKILKLTKEKYFANLRDSYDNGFALDQLNGITFLNGKEEEKKRYEERAQKESNWIEIYKKNISN